MISMGTAFLHIETQDIYFEYVYDCCNRLIKESEVHPHARYETSHKYDLSGRKMASKTILATKRFITTMI